jgi:hypothetical protein
VSEVSDICLSCGRPHETVPRKRAASSATRGIKRKPGPRRRIADEDVDKLVALRDTQGLTFGALANRFDISPSQANAIYIKRSREIAERVMERRVG